MKHAGVETSPAVTWVRGGEIRTHASRRVA